MSFSEWKEYFLGDLVENLSSKRVPLSSRQREGRKGIYPYYGAQGIIDYIDDYIFDGEYLLVAEDGNNLKERKEDIAQIAKGKFWVNNHAHVLINNSYSDIKFIKYYLNQLDITPYITGSAQPKLNKANLSKIKVIAPTKSEQISISNFLGMLDEKIELNNQMNETLEEMAQALFKRWFVDFEFPNEEGKPYKSSGGEMVESELGMIPKGWNIKLASEVVDVKDGTHASPKVVNEGYPLITSKHINGDRLRIEEANLISETDYVEVNKRSKVDTGDILISMIGTVGLLYYVQDLDVNFAIKNLGLFKTSKTVEMQEYIYLYLKQTSMKNYIECRLAGTTQKYISLTELRKIPVLLPTCDLLHTFKEKIEPLLKMKQENINQNQSLVNIRSTLLPKLMSGEIRVSDFES